MTETIMESTKMDVEIREEGGKGGRIEGRRLEWLWRMVEDS